MGCEGPGKEAWLGFEMEEENGHSNNMIIQSSENAVGLPREEEEWAPQAV